MCSCERIIILSDHPPVPKSMDEAAGWLRHVLGKRNSLADVGHEEFLKAWSSVAYLMPGLHPDESGHDDGGWPVGWCCLAAEAFRRSEAGRLKDSELYPYESVRHSQGIGNQRIVPQR